MFEALADPVRRRLVSQLAESSPRTATQLAQHHTISRQAVVKHLAILERARLVATQRAGREKHYILTPEPLKQLGRWIDTVSVRWEARLARLKRLVESQGYE